MIRVYNLATSDPKPEFEFFPHVTPEWAVCYAYASEKNLTSLLFSSRTKGKKLSKHFPLVYGEHSVSCGDYVAETHKSD